MQQPNHTHWPRAFVTAAACILLPFGAAALAAAILWAGFTFGDWWVR